MVSRRAAQWTQNQWAGKELLALLRGGADFALNLMHYMHVMAKQKSAAPPTSSNLGNLSTTNMTPSTISQRPPLFDSGPTSALSARQLFNEVCPLRRENSGGDGDGTP